MNPDTIQDSTRVVVADLRHGSVLPGNRAELWRDVYLLPGAEVRGGVWGNKLAAHGPGVRVCEAVYVRGELHVGAASAGEDVGTTSGRAVTFESCVTTPDSVLVEELPFRTRFLSNVYAGRVKLQNCIVYGNVYARSAVVRNSVILGGIFCQDGVTIEDSIVATFRARNATIGEGVKLLFPVAILDEMPTLGPELMVLSFYDIGAGGGGDAADAGGVVRLGQSDVYPLTLPAAEDGTPGRPCFVLSANQRILDGESVVRRLEQNRRTLESLAMSDRTGREDERAGPTGGIAELEDRLFALATRRALPRVQQSTNLRELLNRHGVSEAFRAESPSLAAALQAWSAAPDAGGDARTEDDVDLDRFFDGPSATDVGVLPGS